MLNETHNTTGSGDHVGRLCDHLEPDGYRDRDGRGCSDRIAGLIMVGLIVFCVGATSAILYFKDWIDQ